jgi:hypothetical protein
MSENRERINCYEFSFVCLLQIQVFYMQYGKVKQFLYRPGQALRDPGGRGSQISRQTAQEGCKFFSSTHQLPLPPQEIFPLLISVRGRVDPRAIVRLCFLTSISN